MHAAASTTGALDGGAESRMEIAGKAQDGSSKTLFQQVTGEYFQALRFDFKQGRPLSEADVDDARKVGVVNETFVRKYLSDDDPIGQRVRLMNLETAACSRRLVRDSRRDRRRADTWTAGADHSGSVDTVHNHGIAAADTDRAHVAGPVDPDGRGTARSVGHRF